MAITALQLRERLLYNPDTGEWTWLKSRRDGYAGKPAGWRDSYGYRRIKIDGQTYIASRLAFLYMTDEWPNEEMDHIDQDPTNDAWENLREATRSENNQNRSQRCDNITGSIGVIWNKAREKWQVHVNKIHFGLYDSFEEATAVRDLVASDLHGEFVQLNKGAIS